MQQNMSIHRARKLLPTKEQLIGNNQLLRRINKIMKQINVILLMMIQCIIDTLMGHKYILRNVFLLIHYVPL